MIAGCTRNCLQGKACSCTESDSEDWKREPDSWDVLWSVAMYVLAAIAIFCALAASAGFFFNR